MTNDKEVRPNPWLLKSWMGHQVTSKPTPNFSAKEEVPGATMVRHDPPEADADANFQGGGHEEEVPDGTSG